MVLLLQPSCELIGNNQLQKGGVMENSKIQQLIKTLSHFGLNPRDWKINSPEGKLEKKIVISHKREKNFNLVGVYNFYNDQPIFDEICLHSL